MRRKVQYTIRDIPENTDSRLRETAASEEISLNAAVLSALNRGLGIGGPLPSKRNLRQLVAGSSVDKAAWDAVLSGMDQVNPEDWK